MGKFNKLLSITGKITPLLVTLPLFFSARMETSKLKCKTIDKIFYARDQGEGDGATVKRYIGTQQLKNLDPFLMFDEAKVKLPAGFPDHPHRGQETVTYMLDGEVMHEDSKGNQGTLGPGDMQWMTAGKGILHSEMPTSFEKTSHATQLWLNLEKKMKYCEPQYQEWNADIIPTVTIKSRVKKSEISEEYEDF